MAMIIVETDDGHRVKVMRVTSRGEFLSREDALRRAVYDALARDALVSHVPPR